MRIGAGIVVMMCIGAGGIGCRGHQGQGATPVQEPHEQAQIQAPPQAQGMKPGASIRGITMVRKAASCPSAVAGAMTEITNFRDHVVATVTATDNGAMAEIRKRARYLEQTVDKKRPIRLSHTGQGTGGGLIGMCPIITANTTIAVEQVAGGVLVRMRPHEAGRVLELAQEAWERLGALRKAGLATDERAQGTSGP